MRALALVALALILAASPVWAAWPNSPFVNLAVSTAAFDQYGQSIVADGTGGAIITWQDSRSGSFNDIYAQHILGSGAVDPAWPVNGVAICVAAFDQSAPAIVSDGAGGAIIAWQDSRTTGGAWDIYAQHVRASGSVDPAWPANGTLLCNAANNQNNATIVSDGAGGAIVTWFDYRPGATADIYAQHVQSSGVVDPTWPVNGRALCTAAQNQGYPTIVSDGAGGAIVTWYDFRSGTNWDIYAQRVLASGAVDPAWPVDGRALCVATNDQIFPTLVSDGAGGAIVTWSDSRSGTQSDIYAQHVLGTGAVDAVWPADGRVVCGAASNQSAPMIISDGAAGAIIAWQDIRGASWDVYAHHVLASGTVDAAWPADGRALCTATNTQYGPAIATDGAAGAIVTWRDLRGGSYEDIYAQHVLSSGAVDPAWPTDGRALSTAANNQVNPTIATDGAGGAIVAWNDYRGGANYDLYAQRVARYSYLGTPEAEITGVKDIPNDNGGKLKVSWNASYLEGDPYNLVSYYNVFRSVPPNAAMARLSRGGHARGVDDAESLAPGELMKSVTNATVYYWELIATVNGNYLPNYSYVASTAEDSASYGNPRTAFMIQARAGSQHWESRPDSGYSVDNLPPLAPTPFAGNYSVGTAQLHWNPNSEPDIANYRLYRGASSGFTPSPGNRIATPADTVYNDPAGSTYWYKLSAVDIHGNESGFTALLPAGALDAPAEATPRALALERPAPNPASVDVVVRYALPREGHVTLAIYDAAGRRVRALVIGTQPAGDHTSAWDLRDDTGRRVQAGLYFVWLEAHGQRLSRRFATLR